MKNISMMIAALALMSSCGNSEPTATEQVQVVKDGETKEVLANYYGEKITDQGIIKTDALMEKLQNADSVACKFSGVIQETCVKKGCWMTLDIGTEEDMRVRFKDYGFFVPTSGQSGKMAVMRGIAQKEVTTVEDLRHYAEDGGMSREEAEAKFTEPEVSIGFLADGVIIYD